MAVLQSNKERTLKLADLNPFITCELCKGYLIKPTTITECLHTFCKSCIVTYLQDSDENTCPSCNSVIHETNPYELLRSDKTLEDIIFRLVPRLQQDEKLREQEFYRTPSITSSKSANHRHHRENGEEPPRKRGRSSKGHGDEGKENYHRDDPQIGVCLDFLRLGNGVQDDSAVRELVKRYIRCSSRMTIGHVKKFLKLKLNLNATDQIEVMCNGEIMGKDHTLEFVYMTRWRVKVKDNSILTLQYRPKLDFS